jgi:hypothetical protein
MSQIPIGWLMKIEGFEESPLTTGLFDDRWYTSFRPLYFYQKDIIVWISRKNHKDINNNPQ